MAKNAETNTQNEILVAMSQAGALVWRNQVGVFRAMDDPNRIIKVGVPGMADVIGVVPVVITAEMVGKTVGVAVGCEVKTPLGKQRDKQKLWQHAMQRHHGIYLITRSPDQAIQQLASISDRIATS
jgi:hypothetical protein